MPMQEFKTEPVLSEQTGPWMDTSGAQPWQAMWEYVLSRQHSRVETGLSTAHESRQDSAPRRDCKYTIQLPVAHELLSHMLLPLQFLSC